jgi:hypothetical protein
MAAQQNKPKQPKNQGFRAPPFLSYDPSIEAERRSQQRGLKDVLHDTSRARGYAKTDYAQKLGDINLAQSRGTEEIGQKFARGNEDITTRLTRGTEDFSNQLTGLIRDFQVKGSQQTQAANAAGVLDPSTQAASAARRAENLAIARKPIDTGQQRLNQDTSLAQTRLGQDVNLATGRLGQDTTRETGLAGTDLNRAVTDLAIKKRRATREQKIGNVDLLQQEIFDARQRKPGAFTQQGVPKKKKKG